MLKIGRSKWLAPAVVLVLTIAAIGLVWILVQRADSGRHAQLQVSAMMRSVADLQSAPFNADHSAGGVAEQTRSEIAADERSISRGLAAHAQVGVPSGLLIAGRLDLASIEPIVDDVYELARSPGGLAGAGARVPVLQKQLRERSEVLSGVLDNISRSDAERAANARTDTRFGTAGAMLLLLLAFAFFYFRSVAARGVVERLAAQNEALLGVSRDEARTDALTGLRNRRALLNDLTEALAEPAERGELLLTLCDLDGFKAYNDTFGHAAGDELLHQLGGRLASAAKLHSASAYRMGGDEFCVLARCRPEDAERLLNDMTDALQAAGDGWHIGCSQGAVWIPSDAATESQALKLADERMYAHKANRSPARRQVTDALVQVILEQNASLNEHIESVAESAGTLAEALGQPDHQIRLIRLAATLHNVGKTAIPASILDKPGPLSKQEWQFVRQHPLIGERIVSAAPALAGTAALILSSHERIDGRGYPDGLSGEQIPLGSRIIAVCDAYHAMTSNRVYRHRMSRDAALQELRRHAGSQFDAGVVEAFCAHLLTTGPVASGS